MDIQNDRMIFRQIDRKMEGYTQIDGRIYTQIDRNIDEQADRQVVRYSYGYLEQQNDIQIDRQKDGRIYTQIDRNIDEYLDGQSARQMDRQIMYFWIMVRYIEHQQT